MISMEGVSWSYHSLSMKICQAITSLLIFQRGNRLMMGCWGLQTKVKSTWPILTGPQSLRHLRSISALSQSKTVGVEVCHHLHPIELQPKKSAKSLPIISSAAAKRRGTDDLSRRSNITSMRATLWVIWEAWELKRTEIHKMMDSRLAPMVPTNKVEYFARLMKDSMTCGTSKQEPSCKDLTRSKRRSRTICTHIDNGYQPVSLKGIAKKL